MSLSPGARLGPYEIVSPLGAGGMGEVYRARDERLKRDVAIKVLPASFSSDPDRLRRFEQEARSAGQLNHPNVLAIYDVGTHEGSPYVVAELLEGETLRDVVAGGAIPLRKAIDYARQTAEGLAAAHEKGIVHRDLKPENLFLTRDGRVKILDFGLAKLTHPEPVSEPGAAATTGPTETESGAVMGTVGYMSPEQLRGKRVDYRSDIFAFGAILYELLSGRRAFHGDSVPETMNAILKDDPPELAASNPKISPGLERVVRRCLEKKPEARFQSTRDLAFALDALSTPSGVVGPPQIAAPAPRIRRRTAAIAVALTLLAVGPLLYLASTLGRKSAPPTYRRLTFRRGGIDSARFAPDGQTIIYGAAWEGDPIRLYSTRLDSRESSLLDLPQARILSISSSGELAISVGAKGTMPNLGGTLARVSLAGGAPRELLQGVLSADWSPDGKDLAVIRKVGTRSRIEFPLGRKLHEYEPYGSDFGRIRVSPGGGEVAFFEAAPAPLVSALTVIDRNGKKQKLGEFPLGYSLIWSRRGDEILLPSVEAGSSTTALYAVTRSGKSRVIARFPVSWAAIHDISKDGRILLALGQGRTSTIVMLPGQKQERDLSWFVESVPVGISADGTKVLFNEQGGAERTTAVYLRKTDGSAAVRLFEGWAFALSPDGNWAVVAPFDQLSKPLLLPTGPGESRALEMSGIEFDDVVWFPESRRLLWWGRQPGRPSRCYVQDIDGGPPRALTAEGITGGPISPDGRSFICRDETGRVLVCPTEGGTPQPLPGPPEKGELGPWSADGRSIFASEKERLIGRVFRHDLETGRRELVRQITPADPAGVYFWNFTLRPDGEFYFYEVRRWISDLYLVEGLR